MFCCSWKQLTSFYNLNIVWCYRVYSTRCAFRSFNSIPWSTRPTKEKSQFNILSQKSTLILHIKRIGTMHDGNISININGFSNILKLKFIWKINVFEILVPTDLNVKLCVIVCWNLYIFEIQTSTVPIIFPKEFDHFNFFTTLFLK